MPTSTKKTNLEQETSQLLTAWKAQKKEQAKTPTWHVKTNQGPIEIRIKESQLSIHFKDKKKCKDMTYTASEGVKFNTKTRTLTVSILSQHPEKKTDIDIYATNNYLMFLLNDIALEP